MEFLQNSSKQVLKLQYGFPKDFNIMLKFSKKSHYLALIIIITSSLWISSGLLKKRTPPQAMPIESKVINSVTTNISAITNHQKKYKIYGSAKAHKIISLKSEINGKVNNIYKNEGDIVKAGEVIFTLEPKQYKAEYAEAKAHYSSKKTTLKTTKELYKKGLSAKTILANHQADFKAAEAKLESAKIKLDNTEILAAFDGKIEEINIETGEIIEGYRTEMATLVNDNKILVHGFLAEKLISDVNLIEKIEVEFFSGLKKQAILNYISATSDAITKTYKIEVLVENNDNLIKDGMTVELSFTLKKIKAHKISSSALSLDDNGNIGVKIINHNNLVEFLPATIIGEEGEYIWLTDLPDVIEIITIGHGFVRNGDQVLVRRDERN
ncbi:MAG: efflux RND transporter periplasmic adaptor subunit [Alphaproteobacteria bacterium]|jgi:membrane fusion protein, multidrug efflux system|nr:efflux RND transporter periplasmic adaptor subunit [Alphaproteobacteria bacterium]MBT5827281.1 efflux RND transporter periplasmic adaptor subunit [Alphaproteobacteria bacterium]